MSVFGICMVKNADDIIGPVVEHMMGQVDHVIVADNLSTDNTRSILDSLSGNITVVDDNDPAYRQSEKMTHLAHVARQQGAQWVVPFDADEWWKAREGTLKDAIERIDTDIIVAHIVDYVPTGIDWQEEKNPIKRIKWRRKNVSPLHKVACRTSASLTIAMGNHNASYHNSEPTYDDGLFLTVKHFPYRTPQQFVDKAVTGNAALALTNLSYETGQHWRDYARIAEEAGDEALKEVFTTWFYSQNPYDDPELIFDPIL